MSAHTPGPWHYGMRRWDDHDYPCVLAADGCRVADCGFFSSKETCASNARLIAAAPDLAAALEAIKATEWAGDFTAADLKLACQRMTMLARAALAKAGLC